MTIRQTLKTFSNMSLAYKAMEQIEKDYFISNKRKITTELTLASYSPASYSYGKVVLGKESVELRCVLDDQDPKHIDEYVWLKQNVEKL